MGSGKAMRRKQMGMRWPAVFLAFLALVSLASLASRYPAESNELSFTPAVGDLGGLAGAEIVTVSPDGKLYVWNRDRSLAFGFPKEFEGGISSSPSLADLDHDGYREILVVVKNPSGGLNLRAFYGNGIEAPSYPITLAFVPSSPLTAADVDKDGLVEIIGGSSDGQLHIWRAGSPGELPGFPKPLSSEPVSITLGDLDHDEVLEIIAGSRDGKVYTLDYTQSEQNEGKPGSWTTSPVLAVGRQIAGVPVVSDLDQDGQADLLVAGSDGTITSYTWAGTQWLPKRAPLAVAGGAIASSPAVGDLDGDGKSEVIVLARKGPGRKIYAFSGEGMLLPGFPKAVNASGNSGITTLGDMLDQGKKEILYALHGTEIHTMGFDGNNQLKETSWGPLYHQPRPLLMPNISAVPNPFSPNGDGVNDFSVIQYGVASSIENNLRIKMYDSSGREVATLADKTYVPSGFEEVVWDGSDDQGRKLADGRYRVAFYAVDSSGNSSKRITAVGQISQILIDRTAPKLSACASPGGLEQGANDHRQLHCRRGPFRPSLPGCQGAKRGSPGDSTRGVALQQEDRHSHRHRQPGVDGCRQTKWDLQSGV